MVLFNILDFIILIFINIYFKKYIHTDGSSMFLQINVNIIYIVFFLILDFNTIDLIKLILNINFII